MRVGRCEFGRWHVFNKKCHVAGPYKTEDEACQVLNEMEQNARDGNLRRKSILIPMIADTTQGEE